jgi:hypothetical protein
MLYKRRCFASDGLATGTYTRSKEYELQSDIRILLGCAAMELP